MYRILILLIALFLSACSDDPHSGRTELALPGVSEYGIFDPSLALDPDSGRIWMSYSAVDSSAWPANKRISTRLAWSDDGGSTWEDMGSAVNPAEDGSSDPVTWEYEVSSLCYQPGAPASERWILLFHRYLAAGDLRLFNYGWIGSKTAATPSGLTNAPEVKLFSGSAYTNACDPIIAPPLVTLHTLHSDLTGCIAFSEPGLLAASNALYAALLGAEGASTNGRIILLKYPYPSGPWEYRGSLLVNTNDAPPLGYHGFSAPSMYSKNGSFYLLVTPQTNDRYLGTLLFRITDLDNALIQRKNGIPEILAVIDGTEGSHRGAAGYIPGASGCGVLYSEVILQEPLAFRIYASGILP